MEYESEIRFPISDYETFMDRLKKFEPELLRKHSFKDHILKPSHLSEDEAERLWNPSRKVLRVRQWFEPKNTSELLFTAVEVVEEGGVRFKRTIFPQGKLKLFEGSFEHAMTLARELGFEPWFTVYKKVGYLYKLRKLGDKVVCIEYVEGVGWVGELEFWGSPREVAESMRECMEALGIESYTYDTMPGIYFKVVLKGKRVF